jgi:NB-ARC domain
MPNSLTASPKALTDLIDPARSRKDLKWNKYDDRWARAADVSIKTLQRFWDRTPIRSANFIRICQAVGIEDWKSVTDASSSQSAEREVEFSVYDDMWVGRKSLVADLKQRLLGVCRLAIISGIAGIGKTALAQRLVIELKENWLQKDLGALVQENFDDQDQAVDFGSVAARLLEKCGQPVTAEERQDSQQLLNKLINHLKANRYLIVIDALERILKNNEENAWNNFEDEDFEVFFQRVLSTDSFRSRIILTSQDMPNQILTIGTRYPNFWLCESLSGLSEAEQFLLFVKTGLQMETESPSQHLMRIGKAYEGHPLALRVIAGEIGSKPFYGSIVAYWNKYGSEIEEVESSAIEAQRGNVEGADDKWKIDRFTSTLKANVRHRLEQTFKRLNKDARYAYILLCETSVYRCPVPDRYWLRHLDYWKQSEEERTIALNILIDKYLVEPLVDKDEYKLRQHNLIRSISLEHFKSLDE